MRPVLAIVGVLMARVAAGQMPVAAVAPGSFGASAASAASGTTAGVPTLTIVAGGSTVVQTEFPIKRFALTNPAIADAMVVDPRQLLVDGKSAGNVSLIVWGESRLVSYDVMVYPPTPSLQRQLHALFPTEAISVSVADEGIVLTGQMSSNAVSWYEIELS